MASHTDLKIVVIEDNQQLSEMISDFLKLKFAGAQVTVYNTGETALQEISFEPNVIVLDYQLDTADPRALNGMQVFMKLKSKFKSPVVFLSGQDRADVSANIIKHGAYDYVVKNQQSFQRLEVIVNNILNDNSQKKSIGWQKIIIAVLAALVVILSVALIAKS